MNKIGKYTGRVSNYLTSFVYGSKAGPTVEDGSLDTPLFTIEGRFRAKIVKVYDGDTVHAVMLYPKKDLVRFKVRLYGINAPEMKGDEKPEGQVSKVGLADKIMDKVVELECKGFGKYGRLLATIYYNEENINEWLVEQGLAEHHDY